MDTPFTIINCIFINNRTIPQQKELHKFKIKNKMINHLLVLFL